MKINTSVKTDTPSRLSEALLLRAAIGDGVILPYNGHAYMVFNAAASELLCGYLMDAERLFVVESPKDGVFASCRNSEVSRSSLITNLSASKFRALSFVDCCGSKLSGSCINRSTLTKYLSWTEIPCLASQSSKRPRKFWHFSGARPGNLETLRRSSVGRSVLIPDIADTVTVESATILKMLRKYFAAGATPEQRTHVVFASEELERTWSEFRRANVSAFHEGNMTASHAKSLSLMPASVSILLEASADAAIVLACIESLTEEVVTIRQSHLEAAKEFATYLFASSSGFDKLHRRNSQYLNASASFKSPERVAVATHNLRESIAQSEQKKISHEAAIRTPGVTAGLLEMLMSAPNSEFLELTGTAVIRMGKTKRAYTLNPANVTA